MPKRLFVGGLPFSYTDDELKALFKGLGTIVSAVMVFDPDRNRSRGFGFVELSSSEEGDTAIAQLNGRKIGDKQVFVTEAREKAAKLPNPNKPTMPIKKVPFRKVGRNASGKPAAPPPPNPYRTREPESRGPGKRSFSSPKFPKHEFGRPERERSSEFKSDKNTFWKKFEKKRKE